MPAPGVLMVNCVTARLHALSALPTGLSESTGKGRVRVEGKGGDKLYRQCLKDSQFVREVASITPQSRKTVKN